MIIGHQKNLKIISTIIKEKRFPHAVLFGGPEKIGKKEIALEIAKYLSSTHKNDFFSFSQENCKCQTCHLINKKSFSEIIEIEKSENQISIKEIREMRTKLLTASSFAYKIVILNNTEALSQEATGALLKTLEEPRGNTIFFLLSSMPKILPKTILSRLSVFKFNPLSKKDIEKIITKKNPEITPLAKEKVIDISLGRSKLAEELCVDKKKLLYYDSLLENVEKSSKLSVFERLKLAEIIEKTLKTEDFLLMASFWFRDLFLAKKGIENFSFNFKKEDIKKAAKDYSSQKLEEILKAVLETKKYIYFSNVSRLLAFENFLLKI